MAIGIGSSWTDDSDDDVGPFSHWKKDDDEVHWTTDYKKEEILQFIKELSIKDRNWILNNLKK